MLLRTKGALVLAAICALSFASSSARANFIQWDIDSTLSKLSLAIPDTGLNLDGTTLTVRIRNQNGTNGGPWNAGNTAFMDGLLNTNYREVGIRSLEFQSNPAGQAFGLNSGNYRPNSASFNSANTNSENPDGQFQNSTLEPAVFGARARASVSILTLDAGYLSFDTVSYNVTSGVLTPGGSIATTQTFAANSLMAGIKSALVSLDGLSITLVGQPIPDTLNSLLEDALAANVASAGTIVNTGGLNRRMTIPLSIPISYDLGGGIILVLNATGQIVANAVVPEPSTFMMAGLGLVSLGVVMRRRFRRR